jgi:hypothetical protein
MADGQVTRGSEVVKPNVKKTRLLGDGNVIGGFAGSPTKPRQPPALSGGFHLISICRTAENLLCVCLKSVFL